MGFLNWLEKTSSVIPVKLSNLLSSSNIKPLSGLTSYLNLYNEDPYIGRSVDIIGNAVAKSNKEVVDEDGKPIDHPILDLMNNPNDQGKSYFLGSTARFLVLGGEAFWEIGTPNGMKVPKKLYNLRPDRIEIVPDEELKSISGYKYSINSNTNDEMFNKDEITHIKTFNPTDDWRGRPAAKPLEEIINADRYGWEWIKTFLKNKGLLKGFLTTEKSINPGSAKRMKDNWRSATSGDGVPLLPGNVDWKNIARPPKESGMVDLTEHISETKIATIGVTKGLLGLYDSQSQDIDIEVNLFYSMTIEPYLNLIEDKINIDLMPRFNKEGTFRFKPDNVGLLDFQGFVESLSEQFDRGSLTPNEFIQKTGVGEQFEGGDKHYINTKRKELNGEQEESTESQE